VAHDAEAAWDLLRELPPALLRERLLLLVRCPKGHARLRVYRTIAGDRLAVSGRRRSSHGPNLVLLDAPENVDAWVAQGCDCRFSPQGRGTQMEAAALRRTLDAGRRTIEVYHAIVE
jgi:hypothetical protein